MLHSFIRITPRSSVTSELIDQREVTIDLNQHYLDVVQRRSGTLAGVELHCCDLTRQQFSLVPVALVHAALIFEHVGLGLALANTLSLIAPGASCRSYCSCRAKNEQAVASTGYPSMQTLKQDFALIDVTEFQQRLAQEGFELLEHESRPVPAGNALWVGIFAKSQ